MISPCVESGSRIIYPATPVSDRPGEPLKQFLIATDKQGYAGMGVKIEDWKDGRSIKSE